MAETLVKSTFVPVVPVKSDTHTYIANIYISSSPPEKEKIRTRARKRYISEFTGTTGTNPYFMRVSGVSQLVQLLVQHWYKVVQIQKGGDSIKKNYYTQHWKAYMGASRHMLRFYFYRPDAKIDEMSPATRDAWFACHRALANFSESELAVLKSYFSAHWENDKVQLDMKSISEQHGLTVNGIKSIVGNALRAVAIERGLADK